MAEEKVNMFEKAAEDRRRKIVEENAYVADEIMATKVDNVEDSDTDKPTDIGNTVDSLKSIIIKEKPKKRRCSYYLDDKVDDFFIGLGRVTSTSKSELVNQLLIIAISNDPDIQELAKTNKKVKKLLDEYYE